MIFTKIHFRDTELHKDKRFHLRHQEMNGKVVLSNYQEDTISSSKEEENQDTMTSFRIPTSISLEAEEINSLNIIINDNDCGDSFFQGVVDKLQEDGIRCTTTKHCRDINQADCTVITLDQQYSAGSDTMIFAPYNNTRLGHSDSLAISMQTAFNQNGFFVDEILCGQVGFEQDENGVIHYSVPTDTERAIDEDKDTSFITISFGTQNLNTDWVAKSIENGLARQKYYLNHYDNQTDLIYRASDSDDIDVVSTYFGTVSQELISYNHIKDNHLKDSQAVVNPSAGQMEAFDIHSVFDIDGTKTKAY